MGTKARTTHYLRATHFLTHTGIAVIILAIGIFLVACDITKHKTTGPSEKTTIAYALLHHSLLAEVALVKEYFRQEGLDVDPHLHPYGKPALEDMLAGNADFATVAETPLMFAILDGADISIISSIHITNKNHAVVARKDKGVIAPGDLKGKKIAVTSGTTSEFFLDSFLTVNAISRHDVELVELRQEELAQALADERVDAVSAFHPYLIECQKKMGDVGISFINNNIHTQTFVMAATKEFVRKHPEKVKKVLRALARAEEFYRQNPEEAVRIVAEFNHSGIVDTREMLAGSTVGLSLDQSLILTLEDQARWAIGHRLTSARKVPDFLGYVYFEGLASVKPEAIGILR